jgi:hypothetical protein
MPKTTKKKPVTTKKTDVSEDTFLDIKPTYSGIVPGAGKPKTPALKDAKGKDVDVEKVVAEQLEEAVDTSTKKEKVNEDSFLPDFAKIVKNDRGGATITIPGRNAVLKIGETLWTKPIDKLYDKLSDGLAWASNRSSKVDKVLSMFVEKYGQTADFKQLGHDYDVAIHAAELTSRRLEQAIDEIDTLLTSSGTTIGGKKMEGSVDFMDVRVKRDKFGRVTARVPRSEASKAKMKVAFEKRKKQILRGSTTQFEKEYVALREATRQFQQLEQELRDRGILNDHQFKALNQRERASITKQVQGYNDKIQLVEDSDLSRHDKVKEINKWNKKKRDLIRRLQIHYKNSGRTYLTQIEDTIEYNEKVKRQLALDSMSKKYTKARKNWKMWEEDGVFHVRHRSSKELKQAAARGAAGVVRKGLTQEMHDMHMHDMFTNIAKHESDWLADSARTPWATNAEVLNPSTGLKETVMKPVKGSKTLYEHKWTGARYRQIPAKSDNFGSLAGMYVEEHVFRQLETSFADYRDFVKVLNKGYSSWKAGKTIYNPATQVRNFVSNMGLAYAIGDTNFMNPRIMKMWVESIREYNAIAGGLKGNLKVAQTKYGEEIALKTKIYSSSFTKAELDKDGQDLIQTGLNKLAELSPNAAVEEMVKLFGVAPSYMYDMMEVSMKSTIYKNARENLNMSGQDAEALAEKALFDYSSVPPAIQFARNFYSPFITYSYKAIPALAKQATRKPWKLAPFYMLLHGAQTAAEYLAGDDEEDIEWKKRNLPDYVERDTMGSPGWFPSHIRVPFGDMQDGRDKYLDMSFYLPWGGATDMASGALGWMPQALAPQHPVLNTIGSYAANADLFTGKPIYLDTDLGGKKVVKFFEKLYNEVAPAPFSFQKWDKVMGAVYGHKNMFGQERYSVTDAMLDLWVGVKFRNINYMEQSMWKNKESQKRRKEIRDEYSKALKDTMIKKRHDPRNPTQDQLRREFLEKMEVEMDNAHKRFLEENDK